MNRHNGSFIVDKQDAEHVPNMGTIIVSKIKKLEEEIILKVLREHLNSEPDINDILSINMMFKEHDETFYYLYYKTTFLGKVIRDYLSIDPLAVQPKYQIRFQPKEMLNEEIPQLS